MAACCLRGKWFSGQRARLRIRPTRAWGGGGGGGRWEEMGGEVSIIWYS